MYYLNLPIEYSWRNSIIAYSIGNGPKCQIRRISVLYIGPKLTVCRSACLDPLMAARLKREDCSRTKHDSAFSQWKVRLPSLYGLYVYMHSLFMLCWVISSHDLIGFPGTESEFISI